MKHKGLERGEILIAAIEKRVISLMKELEKSEGNTDIILSHRDSEYCLTLKVGEGAPSWTLTKMFSKDDES